MGRMRVVGILAGSVVALLLLVAAQRPAALDQISGGLWEITGIAGAPSPQRQCLADTAVLARIEHRDQRCTQTVVGDSPSATIIHYTCGNGGFGRSKLTIFTPRSLRIETQGISGGYPFNYVIQARRLGNCPTH